MKKIKSNKKIINRSLVRTALKARAHALLQELESLELLIKLTE